MNIHTYDGFLDALLAANVDRPAAVRMATAKFGRSIETPSEESLRKKLEDDHVAAGDRLMRAMGFEVVSFSQKKRAKVTAGIPDRRYYRRPRAIVLHGNRHEMKNAPTMNVETPAIVLWWEAKAGAWHATPRPGPLPRDGRGLRRSVRVRKARSPEAVARRHRDCDPDRRAVRTHPDSLPISVTTMTGKPAAPLQPETDQLTSRWWRYVKRKRMVCPIGHHFNNSWSPLETGLIQCKHWIAEDRRECGLWIFAFVIRGGKCVIAEVTQAETSQLEEFTTPAELIDYLGIFEQISARNAALPPAGPSHHDRNRR